MSFLKTDPDTKKARSEIIKMIDEGYPICTEDGRKLYGKDAKKELAGLTFAGDSIFDILVSIITSCWEDR